MRLLCKSVKMRVLLEEKSLEIMVIVINNVVAVKIPSTATATATATC